MLGVAAHVLLGPTAKMKWRAHVNPNLGPVGGEVKEECIVSVFGMRLGKSSDGFFGQTEERFFQLLPRQAWRRTLWAHGRRFFLRNQPFLFGDLLGLCFHLASPS